MTTCPDCGHLADEHDNTGFCWQRGCEPVAHHPGEPCRNAPRDVVAANRYVAKANNRRRLGLFPVKDRQP